MLIISIGKSTYNIPQSWREITIEQALKLWNVVKNIDPKLARSYELECKEDISDDEKNEYTDLMIELEPLFEKPYQAFYQKVLLSITDIPKHILSKLPRRGENSVEYLYLLIKKYVIDLLEDFPKIEIEIDEYFKFEGIKYYYPKTEKIFDNTKYLSDTSIMQFAEATDMAILKNEDEKANLRIAGFNVSHGKFEYITEMIAILCKPKGEEYDEKKVLERAKKFKKLPMSVAWTVFFYTYQRGILLQQISLIRLKNMEKEKYLQKIIHRMSVSYMRLRDTLRNLKKQAC